MIYVGLIHFNRFPDIKKLSNVMSSYLPTPCTVSTKKNFTICYGKLAIEQDMDEVLEGNSSVLMGRIFDKADFTCSEECLKNFTNLNTVKDLERIWGKYIYINDISKSSRVEIFIDPTGQLPFFYYPLADGTLLFSSDIDIICKVLNYKPEIHWNYLYSYLIYGNSTSIQTPFRNVYEIPPGCCLTVSNNKTKIDLYWNPVAAYTELNHKQKDAVSVIKATLGPWIKPYKNICVSLSGGLDSSSLVYCLKEIMQKHQTLTALNYYHPLVNTSNELVHARKVSQETGIRLIEIDLSDSLPFDLPLQNQVLKPNKPFPGLIISKWFENVLNHIPSNGPYTLLSGQGSDHIFMCPPSKKSLSDHIIEKGLTGSMNLLNNIAEFYRDPLYSILKKNAVGLWAYFFACRKIKRSPKHIQKETPDWIAKDIYPKLLSDFIHPAYEQLPLSSLAPGKYEQIDAFYEALASIFMEMNYFITIFYPYLYKPLVEFALSFPSYDLFDKGYDRYPLRKAISNHFKTETVWRRDKNQTTGIFQLGLKKNLERVLDICLYGQFAKLELVDRNKLHKTIMLISSGHGRHFWPFVRLASIEIFLKSWEKVLP